MVLDLNNFQGMVRCIWASKFDGSDNVRPVLAFLETGVLTTVSKSC